MAYGRPCLSLQNVGVDLGGTGEEEAAGGSFHGDLETGAPVARRGSGRM